MTRQHHPVKKNVNLNYYKSQECFIGLALLGAGRMATVDAEAIDASAAGLVTVFAGIEAAAAPLASKVGASVERPKLYKIELCRARNFP